jgi:K+/H+ antiporter YhaU regulatory subunit KhtT
MRRFPPPWTIEELEAGFKVVDSNGQTLAYIYGHADQRDAAIAKALTLDEARRIASGIAKAANLTRQGMMTERCFPPINIQA